MVDSYITLRAARARTPAPTIPISIVSQLGNQDHAVTSAWNRE